MRITPVQIYNSRNYAQKNIQKNETPTVNTPQNDTQNYYKMPANYKYGARIYFGNCSNEPFDINRSVPHIDYDNFKSLNIYRKEKLRAQYNNFELDTSKLVDNRYHYMPLRSEKDMDSFLDVAKMYTKYKDHPIICLGRSPKWFLNASLWMKDGIDDYKFVAFSKYWYMKDPVEGVRRRDHLAPTEQEVKSYRRYLKSIQADPKTIVDNYKKTGKTTIITDYISSGKGASSFLEIMANYADDLGILEDFSKSIEFVGIGNMQYLENFFYDDENISVPKVMMPEILQKYDKNIKQTYYEIKNYSMFNDMLINQNTNECRSTYYPHEAWTVYNPKHFKTGLIVDMKKVQNIKRQLTQEGYEKKHMSHFTAAMFDYRNLLTFRILDALDQRGLLKENHKDKI